MRKFGHSHAQLAEGLDDAPDCLLLTGQPTWSDLAGRLIGKALIRVPTGAITARRSG